MQVIGPPTGQRHSDLYCQNRLGHLRQDFACGCSHKVLLDWSIAMRPQNDKVDT